MPPPSMCRDNLHIGRSVVHTKETLLHFCDEHDDITSKPRDFYTVNYRWKNIRLKKMLEKSSYREDETINKLIRRLEFCSKVAKTEADSNGHVSISWTSDKCRHSFCHICQRIKSARLKSRMQKVLETNEIFTNTGNGAFYFLTFTVKHDEKTRNYNYLTEFKQYLTQLKRSKVYRDLFLPPDDHSHNGLISNIENSIKPNGYHIHSHQILFCRKIGVKASEVQSLLQKKWMKITGDSNGVRFDLIKSNENIADTEEGTELLSDLQLRVLELFKYSTKTADYSFFDDEDVELFCEWVKGVKGKNMINCSGLFRGLQITSYKSVLDEQFEPKEISEDSSYYISKTISVKHDTDNVKFYDQSERSQFISDVKIIGLRDHVDVSSIRHQVDSLRNYEYSGEHMWDVARRECESMIADNDLDDLSDVTDFYESKSIQSEFEVPF